MSSTTLSAILFVAFVIFTLVLVFRAGRSNKKSSDFYDGGGSFSGFQNGLAIAGDYMSAASFLGIAGTIALFGYDGFLYSIGFLVAWLVALLLVAEPLRNSGRFTMGDVLAFRMKQRPVRGAAATSTLVVSIFYLMAQMVGAGALVSLLLGINDPSAKNWIIGGVGILMIVYVTVGGMKGTTYVQIVKAFLLMTGAILLTVMVLWQFGFNISDLLGAARDASGKGDAFLQPGLKFGKDVIDATTGAIDPVKTMISKLDLISLGMALVLGTAGLPHILIRFYTVPTSKAARKSVNWAIGNIGAFYLMTIALGFGAAALVSRATLFRGYKVDANGCLMDAKGAAIMSGDVACTPLDGLKNLTPEAKALLVPVDPSGNVAAPQLAQFLGGGEGTTGGQVFEADLALQLAGVDQLARGAADQHGLHVVRAGILQDFGHGHAPGDFIQAGTGHVARDAEDAGATGLFRAMCGEPFASVHGNLGHLHEGFDVVVDGGQTQVATVDREGRAGARDAALAFH